MRGADHGGRHNILESVALLSDGLNAFNSFCAVGIEPNTRRIKQNLDGSLMLVTALNPHIGYETSAKIALLAHREDKTLRDAAIALGVSGEDFDAWVRPEDMTKPLAE